MDWHQAHDSTLALWVGIRDRIGEADPVELLTDINTVNDMCVKAKEEAGAPWGHCHYCLFYQQYGGCKEVSGRMSEAIVSKDWGELRRLLDDFIAHLRQMEIPPPEAAAPAPA
jgi:hypothetical protein